MVNDLLCPHGEVVQVGSMSGVLHYEHPDGLPCDLLNFFNVPVGDLLLEMTARQTDPFVFFAAFASSKRVRWEWYLHLSKCDAKKLVQALQQAGFLKLLPIGTGMIAMEILETFGPIFWKNLLDVNPDVAKAFVIANGHHSGDELLPMVSIADDKANNLTLDLDRAVESMKKRTNWYR